MRKKISFGVIWSLVIVMLLGTAAMAAFDTRYSSTTNWTSSIGGEFSSLASHTEIQYMGNSLVEVRGVIGVTGSTPKRRVGAEPHFLAPANNLDLYDGFYYPDVPEPGSIIKLPVAGVPAGTYRGIANTGLYLNGDEDTMWTGQTSDLVLRPGIILSEMSSQGTAGGRYTALSMSENNDVKLNENGQTYGSRQLDPNAEMPELVGALGTDGTWGYVYSKDIIDHEPFTSDEDFDAYLQKQDARRKEARKSGDAFLWYAPLYASDGVTVIGQYGWGAVDIIGYHCDLDADGNKVYTDLDGNILDLDADGNPLLVRSDGTVEVCDPVAVGTNVIILPTIQYPHMRQN
jgi:hypothetical protein